MNDRYVLAKELASRSYTLIVFRDSTTTDEDDYIYIAMNPEIEFCTAQGMTMEEAKENLADVRINLIEHLLEHGLEVPGPSWEFVSDSDGFEIGRVEGELGDEWDIKYLTPLKSSEQLFGVHSVEFA